MTDHAPVAGPRAAGPPASGTDQAREEWLRRLLARFEAGALSASEYTERVRRLERTMSLEEMAELAEAAPRPDPGLDPVDMMLLARSTGKLAPEGQRRPRYLWAVLVLIFFGALLVVGLWLAGHAKALHNSGTTGMRAQLEMSVSPPPSLLSSRR